MRTTEFAGESSEVTVLRRSYDRSRTAERFDDLGIDAYGQSLGWQNMAVRGRISDDRLGSRESARFLPGIATKTQRGNGCTERPKHVNV
jgi:hypothetical protein